MQISGIDLDTHISDGTISTYELGSVQLLSKLYGSKYPVLLPNCDESHVIAGGWLLDGIDIQPKILSYKKVIDMSKYGLLIGGYYLTPDPIYFIAIPGWELIAEQNPYEHTVTLYFRQLRKH